jgi:hypothetical protein
MSSLPASPDNPFSFDERLGIYLSVQSAWYVCPIVLDVVALTSYSLSGAAALGLLTYAFVRRHAHYNLL